MAAWYEKELYRYEHRTEEEKAEERRQDNFWWAQFLHNSTVRYQRRHQPRDKWVDDDSEFERKMKKLCKDPKTKNSDGKEKRGRKKKKSTGNKVA